MSDTTHAFASLISGRMSELDISPHDLADAMNVGAAAVAEWVSGSDLPEDDELVSLARTLSLPRSLLREAHRRAEEAHRARPGVGISTEEGPDPDVELTTSTHDQEVPAAVMPAAVVDAPTGPTFDALTSSGFGSPWQVLKERWQRRNDRDRAPTRELSYVEEPRQRTTYQLRATFTVGGVIAMIIILRWAFRGFGSALSDLWETLTGAL